MEARKLEYSQQNELSCLIFQKFQSWYLGRHLFIQNVLPLHQFIIGIEILIVYVFMSLYPKTSSYHIFSITSKYLDTFQLGIYL